MRSISELSRATGELVDANITDTSTTGITSGGLQPTLWKKEVIKFAEGLRYLDQLIYVNNELVTT